MFEDYSAEFYKIGNVEMKENLETFFFFITLPNNN